MNSLLLIALVLFVQLGVNGENCSLSVPQDIESLMPVPFTAESPPKIIYPDETGHLYVENGCQFQLACTGPSHFMSTDFREVGDLLVSCAGGNKLLYNEQEHEYQDFQCDAMPRSQLKVTGQTCQPENYTVATVGFQTADRFLGLYNVCFDKSTKRSLYSWYEARSPYYDKYQLYIYRPSFAKTEELYGKTDVSKSYKVWFQRQTVDKILHSEVLADKYIKNDKKHSLSRGHYAAKVDFFFAFEQSATYYYANAAPQWQVFNKYMWNDVEGKVRAKLAEDGMTSDRRIVVTGSSGLCSLPNQSGESQPLYLCPPNSLPVPLFFWKLVYNVETNDGMVYVGLNNPYREIDENLIVCPNICPDEHFEQDDSSREQVGNSGTNEGGEQYNEAGKFLNAGLVYCCTLESFQRVFGQLDPIVFGQRDN